MNRSNVTRIRFLEQQEQERIASVDAVKMKQVRQAIAWLSPSDQDILRTVLDTSPTHYAYLEQMLEIFKGESIARNVAAHEWHDRMNDNPNLPWSVAPSQSKAHFEAEADSITRIAQQAGISSESRAGAYFAAAYWRYTAALARVIGEDG